MNYLFFAESIIEAIILDISSASFSKLSMFMVKVSRIRQSQYFVSLADFNAIA